MPTQEPQIALEPPPELMAGLSPEEQIVVMKNQKRQQQRIIKEEERKDREREKRREYKQRAKTKKQAAKLAEEYRDDEEPDLIRDILWVYDRLNAPKAVLENAPSKGAKSLWEHATESPVYRKWFFQSMLPKALAKRTKDEEEREEEREEGRDLGIEQVARLLREVGGEDPRKGSGRLRTENIRLEAEVKDLRARLTMIRDEIKKTSPGGTSDE